LTASWGCRLGQLRKGPVGHLAIGQWTMRNHRDQRRSRLARLEATVDALTLCLFVATAVLLVELFWRRTPPTPTPLRLGLGWSSRSRLALSSIVISTDHTQHAPQLSGWDVAPDRDASPLLRWAVVIYFKSKRPCPGNWLFDVLIVRIHGYHDLHWSSPSLGYLLQECFTPNGHS